MAQYIDKSALVAEIERRKKELIESSNIFANQWACGSLDNILSFINILEVKEIDDEPDCLIFPRPAGCYSTCEECPYSVINIKAQKEE